MDTSDHGVEAPAVDPQVEEEIGTVENIEYEPLDSRVVWVWRIGSLFGWAILLLLGLTGSIVLAWALLGQPFMGLVFWWPLPVIVAVWLYWFPKASYRAWGYRIDERVLETRSGIFWQETKLLPLSRLQHVDLNRGPLERLNGLASLVLHTAGTHDAVLIIPGLESNRARDLRDRLAAVGGDDAV